MRKLVLVTVVVALVVGTVTGLALADEDERRGKDSDWRMYCERDSPVPFWQAICDILNELNNKVDIMDNPEKAERGCLACHYPYTMYSIKNSTFYGCSRIPNETKANMCYGIHQSITEQNDDLETCLGCHDGDKALDFKEILHPVHLNSHPFKYYHDGSCSSCHKIGGEYEVLYEKMETHGLGVTNDSYKYFD